MFLVVLELPGGYNFVSKPGISVYLDPDVLAWVNKQAEGNDRSRSYIINLFLRTFMENQINASKQKG